MLNLNSITGCNTSQQIGHYANNLTSVVGMCQCCDMHDLLTVDKVREKLANF